MQLDAQMTDSRRVVWGLVAAHAAARDIKLENAMQGMPVPMHPGAERYLSEKGIKKQGS